MFSVVTATLARRLFSVKRIEADYIRTHGAAFYQIRARCGTTFAGIQGEYRGAPPGFPWKALKKLLEGSGGRVLLAQGLSPPLSMAGEDWLKAPDSERFCRLMLKNGLSALEGGNIGRPVGQTAVLLDWNCRYQEFADILIRHFRTVQIVTHNVEMYRPYVERKLYECGAAVLVGEESTMSRQAALILSPAGIVLPAMLEHSAPVLLPFPPGGTALSHDRFIHSFQAALPLEYASLLPEGVDGFSFMAALFECCGLSELGKLIPVRCHAFGEWQDTSSVAKLVLQKKMTEIRTNVPKIHGF